MPTKIQSSLCQLAILLSLSGLGVADETNEPIKEVKAGQSAPDFALASHAGRQVSLSDFRGKKNVVLLFSRASW